MKMRQGFPREVEEEEEAEAVEAVVGGRKG